MPHALPTTEVFLIAMMMICTLPYLLWRLLRNGYLTPVLAPWLLKQQGLIGRER